MLNIRIHAEEDGMLVAECSPYDVVVQGEDLTDILLKLTLQFKVEILMAGSLEMVPQLPEELKW